MNEEIRVLQIIGDVCGGGVETVIRNYYRHIDKSKVQFDFVVHKGALEAYMEEIERLGGRVYKVTPYQKNIFKFTYEIYRIIKLGNYQVIHSNMNVLSVFPLFGAWLAGAKIRILHNHTTDTSVEKLRTFLKHILKPFAKLFANQYWACSKSAAEWMYGNSSTNNVQIINNAIEIEKFVFNIEKRLDLRKKLMLDGYFVMGHIGRFMMQKNHNFLIDVFSEVIKKRKNSKLLLIGDGPLKEEIMKKVSKLGLRKDVIFLGAIDDIADLYNVMDIFIFPSFYEGLGMVAIEAQCNFLPVIASDKVPEEVKLSCDIDFCNLEMGAIYWAEKILNDGKERNTCLDITSIKNKFDVSLECQKLEKIYIQLVSGE